MFDLEITDVQENLNQLQLKLAKLADKVAPMTEFGNEWTAKSSKVPVEVKRKKLLKRLKQNPENELMKRVKNLTREIRNHFTENKR